MASKTPRISVNKLAEYMGASAGRRKTIIKSQIKPPGEIVVARYRDVYQVLAEYFATPCEDLFYQRALDLREAAGGSDWAKQDKNLSADALIACADVIELVNLHGVKVIPAPKTEGTHPFTIAGVRVSIRPEFLILDNSTDLVCGGIKFSFNKQQPLVEESCEFVATLVRAYLVEQYGVSIDPKRCLSIATPTKQVVCAPKATKAKMAAIEAACEEIAIRWKSLQIEVPA